MTLDELKKIDAAATTAKRQAESFRYYASTLAAMRNLPSADETTDKVLAGLGDSWAQFDTNLKPIVRQVLSEQIADILRITELRLEAQARAASARARALTEQVRSFFDEEAAK